MQLPISITLSRSKSAHLTKKPFLMPKNSIKLLKQSFPPDFFINSFSKNLKTNHKNTNLPKINDLKAFISHRADLRTDLMILRGESSIVSQRRRPLGIYLDIKKCSEHKENHQIIEEIATPCFPGDAEEKGPQHGKKKRKVLFCRGRDFLKV